MIRDSSIEKISSPRVIIFFIFLVIVYWWTLLGMKDEYESLARGFSPPTLGAAAGRQRGSSDSQARIETLEQQFVGIRRHLSGTFVKTGKNASTDSGEVQKDSAGN